MKVPIHRIPEAFLIKTMTYAEKLQDPRWQKKRLEVLERDFFTCQLCGDKKTTLHIHHFCYPTSFNPWDIELDGLITYCKHCHALIESDKEAKNNPYKVIKLLLIKDVWLLAVYNLGNDLVEIFTYLSKTNSISYSVSIPIDFITVLSNNTPEKIPQCQE